MIVHIQLSSTLRKYVSGYEPEKGLDLALDPGHETNALELARQIGLNLPEIKFAMINGKHQPMETVLRENDRIAFFPAVGGG